MAVTLKVNVPEAVPVVEGVLVVSYCPTSPEAVTVSPTVKDAHARARYP